MYSNNITFSRVYGNCKCLYKKVWELTECTMYNKKQNWKDKIKLVEIINVKSVVVENEEIRSL